VNFLPTLLEFTAPGHYPRTARVTGDGQDVDLLPTEGGFDLEFYLQFARGSLSGPPQSLRILNTTSLSFYVQIEGASPPGRAGSHWRTCPGGAVGDRNRVSSVGRRPGGGGANRRNSDVCGRALIGQAAGHIWVDSNRFGNAAATFAHEIGHALGFTHVTRPGAMMLPEQASSNLNDAPTETERLHGAIAYRRTRGHRDIDVDP
jgi:hypothetical protein